MAFIDQATVKKIRAELKKEFPTIKFSVRTKHHSKIYVSVMKSDLFDDGIHQSVNQYWIDSNSDLNDDQKKTLKRIDEIIRVTGDYFDKSDGMTDYFHCAFYYDIEIGKWDKPHQKL